jgi:hypothetical protein
LLDVRLRLSKHTRFICSENGEPSWQKNITTSASSRTRQRHQRLHAARIMGQTGRTLVS